MLLLRKENQKNNFIGVVCGSTSIFFLILCIIIFIVRSIQKKKRRLNEFEDFSYSNMNVIIETKSDTKEISKNQSSLSNVDSIEDDIDFWL